MKIIKWFGLLLLILLVITVIYQYPKLNIISGYAAKNMASTVYIAKRTAASVNNNDHQVPLIELAETQIDKTEKAAKASVFGLMERKAIYREGLGSVLINENYTPQKYIAPDRNIIYRETPFPQGHGPAKDSILADVNYNLLSRALDSAFANPETKRTRTVMVLYKNQLIAERYADGFNRDTPVLGWSMTKSILATLYGILEFQNKIDLDQATGWEEWTDDDRSEITYNHLLRMQSGLEWDEDYTSISDVTRMLFLESDMSIIQANKQDDASPGEIWNYSSGTSNLLSGMLRKKFNKYQEYLNFPYKELIDRIGMYSMLIETDMAGNYVGSSYGWASTADWAKFGVLYLNRGNWFGEQIFAEDWVDYVTKPTDHSDGTYGAHFWLNAHGKYPDVPKDLFSANGYQGQYVFIIPSKDLVVVRTGLAEGPFFDVNNFLRDILRALPE